MAEARLEIWVSCAALKRRSSTSLLAVGDVLHGIAGLDERPLPQGLKPTSLWDLRGTTEVVPFPISPWGQSPISVAAF